VPAAARGEHEHGNTEARLAPASEHGEAVDARQAEIEHHRVVLFRLREKIGAVAVVRAVDHIAGVAERARELPRQYRLVLDDQHPHSVVIAQLNLNAA
jgi:hypothetical protein